jgi:hypothetical protein
MRILVIMAFCFRQKLSLAYAEQSSCVIAS